MGGINVLVVRSVNRGKSPFIKEQVHSLRKLGVSVDIFGIKGKGKVGYLKNAFRLRKRIKRENYHLIHAHVGLSGLVANLQRKIPVITTFHGTDVNLPSNIKYSKMAARLSRYNILTNKKLNHVLRLKEHYAIIPCGINLENFRPMDRNFCKKQMKLSLQKDYILFCSSFQRKEKNAQLAQQVVRQLKKTELIELKGYTPEEVNFLINASRLVLMTSHYESAPLIIKETLACNRPVVSTDVGDVKDVLDEVQGSYLVDYDVNDVVQKCRLILNRDKTYESRESMEKYALPVIAEQIKKIYLQVLND